MRLLDYDNKTGEISLKLERDEFGMLCNLADCMAETYESTDGALLGMTQEQVKVLYNKLQAIVKENLKNRGLRTDEQTRSR